MSLVPGIRSSVRLTSNLVIASLALVTLPQFTFNSGVSAKILFDIWVSFTIGATGGFRAQLTTPVGGSCNLGYSYLNGVTPSTDGLVVVALNTPFADALAVAGTHQLRMSGYFENSTTDGAISFQMGQNTTDALTLTVLAGSYMNVTRVN